MSTGLAVAPQHSAVIEQVVIQGDLAKLQPAERVNYYRAVCESVGLNPFTQPFEYISLNGKLRLYAKRDCTDQLRAIKSVSVNIVSREKLDDLLVVTARATTPDGRCDESIGAVVTKGLQGEALANAMMKAETKAKRRVTLSICGLGMIDESEVASTDGKLVRVDTQTGDILDKPQVIPANVSEEEKARNAQKVVKRLELTRDEFNEFKAVCEAEKVSWTTTILDAEQANVTDYVGLMRYVKEGEIPVADAVLVEEDPFADDTEESK